LGEFSLPPKGVFNLSNSQDSNPLQMSITEILDRWPEVIPVFLSHKMACVGCSLADFMTLEDALDIYHLNKEQFIEEFHKTIQPQDPEADNS
jgi:hybrid cluster-associated redox disulfide protein